MTEKEGKAVSIQDPKVEEENHEKRVLKKASSSFLERNVPLLPFFVVPHQRKKRWTDPDPHLHKDWGDIFFDLFFVAAAYNLGNVLREDPTTRGLLYFMACFLPLTAIYQMKVFYDSRFGKSEDFWHFLCDTALYLFLAVAVLNIRTVRVMAQPAVYNDMFAFCLSVSLCFFLSTGRSLEIIFCYRMWPSCRQKPECNKHNNDDTNDNKDEQQGDSNNSQDEADAHNHHDLDHNEKIGLSPCALSSARDDASSLALATIVAIAASIYTGLEYHGSKNDDDSSHRLLAGDSEAAISYLKSSDADDTAAWLLLAACAATILYWAGLALYLKIKEIDFQRYVRIIHATVL